MQPLLRLINDIWDTVKQSTIVSEEERILRTSADELRRKYAELVASFDQLRTKVLAFIAGEIALIAFLFATGMNIPTVIYGICFFLVGVGAIAASFIVLALTLRSASWSSPGSHEASTEATDLDTLKNICEDYTYALDVDTPIYNTRSTMFDTALTLLFVGVTILLVIKYGQGEILWHNIIR